MSPTCDGAEGTFGVVTVGWLLGFGGGGGVGWGSSLFVRPLIWKKIQIVGPLKKKESCGLLKSLQAQFEEAIILNLPTFQVQMRILKYKKPTEN